MQITFRGSNSAFFFDSFLDENRTLAATTFGPNSQSDFLITNTATGMTATVSGAGFAHAANGVPIAGQISSIDFSQNGIPQGSIDGFDWNAAASVAAINAVATVSDFAPLARLMTAAGPIEVDATATDTGFSMADFFDDMASLITAPVTATGSSAEDMLLGATSHDSITGGTGQDTLMGGNGNDTLDGGTNSDRLYGGEGNDVLSGGGSIRGESDNLFGGNGDDLLILAGYGQAQGEHGNDTIRGESFGEDRFENWVRIGYDLAPAGIIANLTDMDIEFVKDANSYNVAGKNPEGAYTVLDGYGTVDKISGAHAFIGSAHDDFIILDANYTSSYGSFLEVRPGAGNDLIAFDEASGLGRLSYFNVDGAVAADLETQLASDRTVGANHVGFDAFTGVTQFRGSKYDDLIYGAQDAVDLLQGDDGDDLINGRGGNDQLWGGAGNDTLFGENGDDLLYAGAGEDRLDGGIGDDFLRSGLGGDTLNGGEGNDRADYWASEGAVVVNLKNGAALGNDAQGDVLIDIEGLSGSLFDDRLTGDDGQNELSGGDGNDLLAGLGSADQIYGGSGDDSLAGGDGDDILYGGIGHDRIFGNADHDVIYGSQGNDIVNGGSGNDTIYGSVDNDTLVGGSGDDTISGGDDADALGGSAGNDTLNGGSGDDRLFGGTGADSLKGGWGNDVLSGMNDDDFLSGDGGTDGLNGGAGNDVLQGGLDADRLYGGSGADTLNGDEGDDLLVGQSGIDTFVFDAGWGHDRIAGYGNVSTGQPRADEVIDLSSLGITFADLTVETFGSGTRVFITEDGASENSIEVLFRGPAEITTSDFLF